jgi:hypothetical protein
MSLTSRLGGLMVEAAEEGLESVSIELPQPMVT